jgi:hypothetical protein
MKMAGLMVMPLELTDLLPVVAALAGLTIAITRSTASKSVVPKRRMSLHLDAVKTIYSKCHRCN